MARQYSKGHGKSGSSLPYVRKPAAFQKMSAQEIVDTICGLAKKGMTPSKIGLVLRDQYAVGLVNHYTGSRIARILEANGIKSKIPEDLYFLIKRSVSMRKHLERNPSDVCTKHHIILVESRIYRMVRYYKRAQKLAASFRFKSREAPALLASM